jgi:hypothetical protein
MPPLYPRGSYKVLSLRRSCRFRQEPTLSSALSQSFKLSYRILDLILSLFLILIADDILIFSLDDDSCNQVYKSRQSIPFAKSRLSNYLPRSQHHSRHRFVNNHQPKSNLVTLSEFYHDST